jgi:FkbM family methyltransferase
VTRRYWSVLYAERGRPATLSAMSSLRKKIVSMAPGPSRAAQLLQHEVRAQRSRAIPSVFGFTLRGGGTQGSGTFEHDEVGFIQRELPTCDAFIDVGANVGIYTCLARQAGKPTIAIEPLPDNQRYLFQNLLDNDFGDVSVFPVAVGARPGLLTLFGSGTGASFISGWAGAKIRTTVPVATLDSIVKGSSVVGQRMLIKVDVEGTELGVLQGAHETLAGSPAPIWLVEICLDEHHPAGQNPDFAAVFETFWSHGYHATSVDTDRVVTQTDVAEWARSGRRSFGGHNYVFRKDAIS